MTAATIVLAAMLAAAGLALLQPPRAGALARLVAERPQPRTAYGAAGLAVALAGVSVWLVVGGGTGLALAVGVALWLRYWLASIPSSEEVARVRRRESGLPVAVDLLAACLASGASTLRSLQAVSVAVEPSLQHDLGRVVAAMQVGGGSDEAWSLVSGSDLAAVASAMRQSAVSGAPASARLGALAVELRERLRARALSDARALGVRSAGPLGVCFLPAFLLIGVVPLVAGLVDQWL